MTWDDHKKNFARLARDGGYTIAQYAAEFNLNPNTARRYLRAFKEDTRTADSRKPNKPVRKPLKSMIIDHANDQRAGDHIVAEIAEKQRVNAVVRAAVENAKRQNKRINDRSDDHDVITRAHRTLRDRLERDTLDDDGERFEFEAGDYPSFGFAENTDDLFVGKTLLHGDVLMWLMKTLLISGCTNQRGAGQTYCCFSFGRRFNGPSC